jgi:hypothetical protein
MLLYTGSLGVILKHGTSLIRGCKMLLGASGVIYVFQRHCGLPFCLIH